MEASVISNPVDRPMPRRAHERTGSRSDSGEFTVPDQQVPETVSILTMIGDAIVYDARVLGARSAANERLEGIKSVSARMQPCGQERVWVEFNAAVIAHVVSLEQFLQASLLVSVEYISASPQEFAAYKDLRNRSERRACGESLPDLASLVTALVFHGI